MVDILRQRQCPIASYLMMSVHFLAAYSHLARQTYPAITSNMKFQLAYNLRRFAHASTIDSKCGGAI